MGKKKKKKKKSGKSKSKSKGKTSKSVKKWDLFLLLYFFNSLNKISDRLNDLFLGNLLIII
jgi:hypothetical protein